jgi:hypothetical protein
VDGTGKCLKMCPVPGNTVVSVFRKYPTYFSFDAGFVVVSGGGGVIFVVFLSIKIDTYTCKCI